MQIQLSTYKFRVFYGPDFGRLYTNVIDAFEENEIDFGVRWFDGYAIIFMMEKTDYNRLKLFWSSVLESLFENIIREESE